MSAHAGTELLSAYLDGQVPEAARARLEAHLASCPECAGKRAALEAAVGAVAALPPVSPTAGEKEAIRRGVLERVTRTGQPAGRGAGAWRPTLRWRLSAAGGAAALVIAGVFA
ncbi:MAG TPA: zf-HC2 domain-containing protein, partial [Actinomycetota bacterium]|nr:zf-HC2 domain-containing protein [Actinomycetota bacterium]